MVENDARKIEVQNSRAETRNAKFLKFSVGRFWTKRIHLRPVSSPWNYWFRRYGHQRVPSDIYHVTWSALKNSGSALVQSTIFTCTTTCTSPVVVSKVLFQCNLADQKLTEFLVRSYFYFVLHKKWNDESFQKGDLYSKMAKVFTSGSKSSVLKIAKVFDKKRKF